MTINGEIALPLRIIQFTHLQMSFGNRDARSHIQTHFFNLIAKDAWY
jgi:hypothetical protein